MNIKFKILWFEDELEWYKMEKNRVESIIKKHCLEPVITRRIGNDFKIEDITGNDYDLILMDFGLYGITGDDIALSIRDNNTLTDILFYSSDEENMINAIHAKMPKIDGVYFTKRDYQFFTNKVEKLVDKIVRRSEDIVNLRGFVLDNTSSFEVRIRNILDRFWEKSNDAQKNELEEQVQYLMDKCTEQRIKGVDKVKGKHPVFLNANKDKYLLSIFERLDILNTIINILCTEYHLHREECFTDFRQYYYDNLNTYRNKLSHVKTGETSFEMCGEEVQINQNLHRLLRKNILEIDEIISKIEEHLEREM